MLRLFQLKRKPVEPDMQTLRSLSKYPRKYVSLKAVRGTVIEKRNSMEAATRERIEADFISKEIGNQKTLKEILHQIDVQDDTKQIIESEVRTAAELLALKRQHLTRMQGLTEAEIQKLLKCTRIMRYTSVRSVTKGPYFNGNSSLWTDCEDEELLELAREYNVNFGDAFIYISYFVRRNIPEVTLRYAGLQNNIVQNKPHNCIDFRRAEALLHLNRDFRMMVPKLICYIPQNSEKFLTSINEVWKCYEDEGVFETFQDINSCDLYRNNDY